MSLDLNAIRDRIERYTQTIGPGGEKAWHAGQLAADVPALLAEIDRLAAANDCYRHALRHIHSRAILAPTAPEYSHQAIERHARRALALEVLDLTEPPGGYVCAICRTPVESEPCTEHGQADHG